MMATDDQPQQVKRGGGPGRPPGRPQYQVGATRSVKRLAVLRFDPIGELVKQYRRIEQEVAYLHKLREGSIVELNPVTGKPRVFRGELLISAEALLQSTNDKLLRYGYGRVPETTVVESKVMQPLVVNLSKQGDTYVVNGDAVQPEYDDSRELSMEGDDYVDPLMLEAPPVKGVDPKSIVLKKAESTPWEE